jgi:predicted Rossmann fold flavoprotein
MSTLIVIGGGAAGFFCAVNAARMHPGLKVILVEKSNKLLSKVRISGGGRCNVTHHCFDIAAMSRNYPRGQNFVKKAFHQFFTTDTIQWFEERGVKLKAEADGRMFPTTDSSQTIIDCLLKEANRHKVEIRMNAEVREIGAAGTAFQPDSYRVQFSNNDSLQGDFICIACGGYPKSSMFDWLRKTGHSIEKPVPSLFTFNMPGHPINKLMGVSVEKARVRIAGSKLEQEGPLLITHWGLSGPAILKLSAWGARELAEKNYDFGVMVNWLPHFSEQQLADEFRRLRFELASQKLTHKNPFGLPQRLWEFLLDHSGVKAETTRWADLPVREQNILVKNLSTCVFNIRGKTTFKEEFVTAGGIRLGEINPSTMESRIMPHLFFAGEILDADGITGGFNFQHAWTSGWVAAAGIVQVATSKKS